jgi:peptidoglycan DL-endopeptidase CwlO
MTSRLLPRPAATPVTAGPAPPGGPRRVLAAVIIAVAAICLLALAAVPVLVGTGLFVAASAGCPGQQGGTAGQPPAGPKASTIPARYLYWYKRVGQQYQVPWTILAGIGTVESDNGRSTLPGVHSGSNPFGAAGPMQIGIGGAAGNVWGGAPVHPASQPVNGVATDEDGGPDASVYDPADAIAGAAKYLLEYQVQTNPPAAIFAYNHLQSYVQDVLYYASAYASGNHPVLSARQPAGNSTAGCTGTAGSLPPVNPPSQLAAAAIGYAEAQLGKPYQWGATGPDAFDCSGLVMMAYRAAGINIARTSQQQWATQTRIPPSQVQPGDLVFFAGSDGTPAAPGHVGLVIGHGQMIEAYATGVPIRITSYTDRDPVGFTRPWTTSSPLLMAPFT